MNKLKGIMREKGITQQELANYLGISVQSLNSKLNNRTAFTIPQAVKISKFLSISNPELGFFNNNDPEMQQQKEE